MTELWETRDFDTLFVFLFRHVRKGFSALLGTEVVIKVCARTAESQLEGYATRFLAKTVAAKHPHLCRMYDAAMDPDSVYVCLQLMTSYMLMLTTPFFSFIVMELCPGVDLWTHLEANRAFSSPKAALIVAQLVSACRYLLTLGMVHRDIKCENIIYCPVRRL